MTTPLHLQFEPEKLRSDLCFSRFHRIPPPPPHFLFKMRKNKKTSLLLFLPIQTEDTMAGLSCRRSRSEQVWAQQPKYLLELRPAAKIILVSPVKWWCTALTRPGRVPIKWKIVKTFKNIYGNARCQQTMTCQFGFVFKPIIIISNHSAFLFSMGIYGWWYLFWRPMLLTFL